MALATYQKTAKKRRANNSYPAAVTAWYASKRRIWRWRKTARRQQVVSRLAKSLNIA